MDEIKRKWNIFEKTGNINDFLHYKELRQEEENGVQDKGSGAEEEGVSE